MTHRIEPGSIVVPDDAAAVARQLAPSLTVETLPILGDARQVLLDLAPRAHLIVLGSRGRGTVWSMLLGSVSAAVSKHAACPVVVCRPTRGATDTAGVVVGRRHP